MTSRSVSWGDALRNAPGIEPRTTVLTVQSTAILVWLRANGPSSSAGVHYGARIGEQWPHWRIHHTCSRLGSLAYHGYIRRIAGGLFVATDKR